MHRLTNRQTTARLVIAERTVDTHIRRILAKPGCAPAGRRSPRSPLPLRQPQLASPMTPATPSAGSPVTAPTARCRSNPPTLRAADAQSARFCATMGRSAERHVSAPNGGSACVLRARACHSASRCRWASSRVALDPAPVSLTLGSFGRCRSGCERAPDWVCTFWARAWFAAPEPDRLMCALSACRRRGGCPLPGRCWPARMPGQGARCRAQSCLNEALAPHGHPCWQRR